MWYDILKDILSSDAGSFSFVFFTLSLISWVIYKVTVFITVWKIKKEEMHKLNDKVVALDTGVSLIEENTKYANCSNNTESIRELKATLKEVDNILKKLSGGILQVEEKTKHANCTGNTENIRELKSDIKDINIEVADIRVAMARGSEGKFGRKKSPKVLTELGERIYAEIEGAEFLKANKDALFTKLDKEHPKTALDVQMMSYWACISISKEDVFNKIKNYIYNCPELHMENSEGQIEKHELTLSDVCSILSLPLRDMYLEVHPEIEM
ncbi:MAG: hypothetical protein IKV17_07580 [Bacteroidaceae bacterium]|nr:hypothetical protein [Bacteroidaceae bacterium]